MVTLLMVCSSGRYKAEVLARSLRTMPPCQRLALQVQHLGQCLTVILL